ncbi:putative RiPP precursor [Mesorhizobium sp. B2-3-12]|nr:putative RiPP precursor [Mesorhizobium sp. B2-3-12]
MKKIYEKPALIKRERLSFVTAGPGASLPPPPPPPVP